MAVSDYHRGNFPEYTSHNVRNFNNSLQTVLILKLVSGISFAYNKKACALVDADLLLMIRW